MPYSAAWSDLVKGTDRWVALGAVPSTENGMQTSSYRMAYSYDGITFAAANSPIRNCLMRRTLYNQPLLAFGKGVFIVGVFYGQANTNYGGIYKSSDGINWTQVYTPNSKNGILSLVYGEPGYTPATGRFVALESVPSGFRILSSSDGITWNPHAITGSAATGAIGPVFVNNRFIVATNTTVYTSVDGDNWQSSPLNPTVATPRSIAYGNGRYIIMNASTPRAIAYSDDGINWITVVNSRTFSGELASNPTGFAAVMISTTSGVIFSSSDGIVWTTTSGSTAPDGRSFKVFYGNEDGMPRFITLGTQYMGGYRLVGSISDNGVLWGSFTSIVCPETSFGVIAYG